LDFESRASSIKNKLNTKLVKEARQKYKAFRLGLSEIKDLDRK
jgi:hypothetical protein